MGRVPDRWMLGLAGDGEALLRVTMDGRWLKEVDGDGPGEVEQSDYDSVMNR